MIVGVEGTGVVGARAIQELAASPEIDRVLIRSSHPERVAAFADGSSGRVAGWSSEAVDAVVLAGSGQATRASSHLEQGRLVVSTAGDSSTVQDLLSVDQGSGRLIAAVGFSPGLSCLLVRRAAATLDEVHEIHVATAAAGGKACEQDFQDTATRIGREWCDGRWVDHEGGSGRELVWFPAPLGALDVGYADLSEPELLHSSDPTARLVSARLRPPVRRLPFKKAVDPLGAVRVDVRGLRDGVPTGTVYAVLDNPSVVAGTLAAIVVTHRGAIGPGVRTLTEVDDPGPMLRELARRGIKAATPVA